MPPPNVTGKLHMGHAMFVALQDIMARFHRMRQRPTLWLPGTDHAGIATQMLVEKDLAAQGLSRKEIGREAFLERAWEYKEDKGGAIVEQMRRLGASADWSRERFTLEPDMSKAVREAFVRFHEQGLVFRGSRMVNWSPSLQTAVSDLEVEFSEEQGTLYYFKYMLAGSDDYIPVATTRPETILGDSAVCVHPEDPRYQQFIGKTVLVPSQGREIPVIADEYVDREFGTGALKITPAHDQNDYEIGKRHDLEMINIMNKDGTINKAGGKYTGLDRYDAREQLWADMDTEGLVIKAEPHTQRVPRSQRGGEVIEPMVSTQWFVDTKDMAAQAVDAVKNKEITILPPRFEKMWYYWLESPRDWCVSRQLWWGHRIPVWFLKGSDRDSTDVDFFVARSEADAYEMAREKYGSDVELEQDDDVLDTWFSSGLWPFATLGWPEETADLTQFYPTTLLETGYDILFFWVARMVMMGINLTGKPPFEVIYMHGLVRSSDGTKMSKTKGNVIDPLDTIDTYGADALRYSLVTGVTPGQDIPLSMEKVEANRNFANKLWNSGRYLIGKLQGIQAEDPALWESLAVKEPMGMEELMALPLAERYIVSRCHELATKVTAGLLAYNMADSGSLIYQFLWDEYADWYIEASKTKTDGEAAQVSLKVLVYVFDTCLRLLHPYMPYVTEILWQQLPKTADSTNEALMTATWPKLDDESDLSTDPEAMAHFTALQALVRSIRNARAEYQVEPGKKIAAQVVVTDPSFLATIESEASAVALLGRIDPDGLTWSLERQESMSSDGKAVHLVVAEGLEAFLPFDKLVDAAKERKRLNKQATKIEKDVAGLEKRLGSEGFLKKASPEIIQENVEALAEKKERLAAIEASLSELKG
uniref:valine--tRNA ligase n=1 Tax=Octactis speculum TaxID=3111310 RepID=A0A7S2AXJ4_9STRA